jgi:glycosyltransferase involved in cell wall biosynthesis
MDVTVIVCTYNRCGSLATALESIAASEMTVSAKWEILVVDNNSSDQTREVVKGFCQRHPGLFSYVFEKKKGLSNARNTGIRQAKGNVVVFTDDDVTVGTKWLRNLTAELSDGQWAGAGGRILAARAFSPPVWFALNGPYSMGGVLYAHFDLGGQAGQLDRPPHGANMAFRKEIFEKYGGFRVDLGPSPGNEIRNDDTEFGRRLMTAGERLRYEPSAEVFHEVVEERLKKDYFLKWWFSYGRAQIRETGVHGDLAGIPRHYFSIPHIALRHLPVRMLQWITALNPPRRFYCKCMVWVAAGWLVETSQLARLKRRKDVECLNVM